MTQEQPILEKDVILFGPAWSGKTTLLNLLIGNSLIPCKESKLCDQEYIKSSIALNSKTKEFNTSQNTILQDGSSIKFIESHGLIDNSYIDSLHKILKTHEFMKNSNLITMIVIDMPSIEVENGVVILNTLYFFSLLYKDFESFPESVLLVFTKYNEDYHGDKKELVNHLVNIIEQSNETIKIIFNKDETRQLIEFIKKIKNVYTFSKPPKSLKTKFERHENEKQSILQAICRLKSYKPALENSEIAQNDIIKLKVSDLFEQFKEPSEMLVIYYLTKYLITSNKYSYYSKLKYLEQLENLPIEQQIKIYNKLQIEKQSQQQQIYAESKESFQQVQQSEKSNNVSFQIEEESKKLIFNIKDLSQICNKIKINDKMGEFEGQIIYSSQLEKIDQQINTITIKTEYFVVDSNLTKQSTNIFIKSKQFIVTQNSIFNLSGKKGDQIQEQAIGEEGKPGNPGYPAGNLILITDDVKTTKDEFKLEVDLSGGEGGDGQQGGNGYDGICGEDGNIQVLQQRRRENLVKTEGVLDKSKNIFFFNSVCKLYYEVKGSQGQNGSDSFKGGCCGHQGNHGKAILLNQEGEELKTKILHSVTSQRKGQNGKHGDVGKGGKQGRTLFATYQKESIFNQVNQIGSQRINYMAPLVISGSLMVFRFLLKQKLLSQSRCHKVFKSIMGLSFLHLAASLISVQIGSKFITNPQYKNQLNSAQNGNLPKTFNSKNIQKPIQNNIECPCDQDFCKFICNNNQLCKLRYQTC